MTDKAPLHHHETPRIVLYSHDTLGYGHFRRNIMIANSLHNLARAPDILMLAGMREAGRFDLPEGTDIISLPAYSKDAEGNYSARHCSLPLAELAALRAATILAAVQAFKPDILIIDNVPRGAQNELEPTLRHLKETGGTHVVLGLRDVIDTADEVRRQWLLQDNFTAVEQWYDEVWVYGSAGFYNLVEEYGMGPDFAAKTRFTGYLNRNHAVDPARALKIRTEVLANDPRPYVLVMVGGGRDGMQLCESFAQAKLPAGMRGILVTGSQIPPAEAAYIAALVQANPDITLLDFVPETLALIAGAERVIAMGGYNSICEVLSLKKHALIIPRVTPRAEQLIRAERLSQKGYLDLLHPQDLTPLALEQWMRSPAPTESADPDDNPITMNGLENIAHFANEALIRSVLRKTRAETE